MEQYLDSIQSRLNGPRVDYSEHQREQDTVMLLAAIREVVKSYKGFVILGASDPDETTRVIYNRCAFQLREDLKSVFK
jgi:hypothetical protein